MRKPEMTDKICYIVGAGECYKLDFKKGNNDLVIAADGGYKYLFEKNIEPDIWVGDMDSLDFMPNVKKVITLDKEKDFTDTFKAVETGLKAGYKEFHLYACCGGRFDHTMANIGALNYLANNSARGYLYDKDTVMTVINNGELNLQNKQGIISIFCLTDTVTVTLKGLKYPLFDYLLTNQSSIGISNEFTEEDATITAKNGSLLIIYPF